MSPLAVAGGVIVIWGGLLVGYYRNHVRRRGDREKE